MEKKHLDDMFTLQFYLNIVAYTVQCNVELKDGYNSKIDVLYL